MKILQYLSFLLFLGVFFTACKKEDPPAPEPVSGFSADRTTVAIGDTVHFTNNSTDATAFRWSFGDGTISTEKNPSKAYSSSAVFTVNLTSTGAGGTTTSSIEIRVLPLCAFEVENENALSTTEPVQFVNLSRGAQSYLWSFGDATGATSTDANPGFSYTTGGVYTVTLTATSAAGTATASRQITVTEPPAAKELFFIEYNAGLIKKLILDGAGGSVATVLDINGKAGVGMAYDDVNNWLYFSDFEITGSGKIWRCRLDGSELTAIVDNLTDPYGIALDQAGGKIYWADDDGNISRANLDGSSPEIGIVHIAGGQMRAVALAPQAGKMFFYEVNLENLYVANLDGSNPSIVVSGVYGYAIEVDETNQKIYFDDQNSNTLIKANLDGTGQQTIDNNGTRIYGMAIDHSEGKIYWSGRDSGQLTRANLDGSSPEILLNGLSSPRGLILKL